MQSYSIYNHRNLKIIIPLSRREIFQISLVPQIWRAKISGPKAIQVEVASTADINSAKRV